MKELTPNQFLTQCTGKRIYVLIRGAASIEVFVCVTKKSLRDGLALQQTAELVRFEEYPNAYFIHLIY